MIWDKSRFQKLESRIILTAQKKSAKIDVPFIIFLYEPSLELRCISEFTDLAKRLRVKEISAELIWLNKWLLDSLESIDTIENLAKFEKQDRHSISEDLSNMDRGLTSILTKKLSSHLSTKSISHCAILMRVGSLFPFVHVSSLLTLLEGVINCMLVIPYPGKDGEMLNYRGGSIKSYYRGVII